MKKLTILDFIEKSRNVHGDEYDYSNSKYINFRTKIEIICKKHGSFFQIVNNHIGGSKCPKCYIEKKIMDSTEFINRCKKIHGNKYNYSKSIYKGKNIKIKIICNIHGEFYQFPSAHWSGCGCSKCYGNKKLTNSNFIKKSNIIHNNKYDYSKVNYINNRTKVIIICKNHGEYLQKPNDHLNGTGCPSCGGTKKLNTNIFIKKSNIIHNNKYDYSKVNYINNRTKVIIICKKHGEFPQNPCNHLNGQNCPICSYLNYISKGEQEFLNYLNINEIQIPIRDYIVDGYDSKNNIIYEFLGDYWHGNLNIFDSNKINKHLNKTYNQLNKETFDRFQILKNLGYIIKYIWESDWNNFKKNKSELKLETY